jgi:tryptophanyl-tRNA synthetase
MTQFKTKAAGREAERVSTGLYTYPVLQAADILAYQPTFVPVGEDQRQHVELAKDVAQRFNNLFAPVFTEPSAMSPAVGARVMGLDDAEHKMSKTVAVTKRGHAVGLLDEPDEIRRTIMRAQTDSGADIRFETAQPGVRNLLTIYEALTGQDRDRIEKEFDGRGYGDLKKAVAEVVVDSLAPIRARYHELLSDTAALEAILRDGAERAGEVAERTLSDARRAMGLEADHLI